LYDQRGDFDPRHPGARPASNCTHAELTVWTRVAFLASDSGGDTQVYDGDRHGRRKGRLEAFPQEPARATGPWNMAHHCRRSTGLYLLSQCMLSCTPKRAPHNYAYQIMHTFPSGEHCNYLDVAPGLQPQTTTQLQGNELRPRAIYYADDDEDCFYYHS